MQVMSVCSKSIPRDVSIPHRGVDTGRSVEEEEVSKDTTKGDLIL